MLRVLVEETCGDQLRYYTYRAHTSTSQTEMHTNVKRGRNGNIKIVRKIPQHCTPILSLHYTYVCVELKLDDVETSVSKGSCQRHRQRLGRGYAYTYTYLYVDRRSWIMTPKTDANTPTYNSFAVYAWHDTGILNYTSMPAMLIKAFARSVHFRMMRGASHIVVQYATYVKNLIIKNLRQILGKK